MDNDLSADTTISLAQRTGLALGPLRELADHAQRADLDLSAAMRCALDMHELHAATALGLAAALRGRSIAPDLLQQLLPEVESMCVAACLLKACPDDALAELVVFLSKNHLLHAALNALCLFVACTRASEPPAALVSRIRRALRRRVSPIAEAFAVAAAAHIDDPHVVTLLGPTRDDGQALAHASARMVGTYVHDPLSLLPLEPSPKHPPQLHPRLLPAHPRELDSPQLIIAFRALQRVGRLEAAEAILSALATRGDAYAARVDEWREELIEQAISMGRLDIVGRQEALFEPQPGLYERLRLRIGLAKQDLTVWPFIEARARAGLAGDVEALYDVVFGLLDLSPGLGVLVARGAFHRERILDNEALYESLLDARDDLGLPPHEAYGDVLDAWVEDSVRGAGTTSAALQSARQDMEVARAEGLRLERQLRGLETRRAERQTHRARVAELKARICEAAERRRALRKRLAELVAAQANSPADSPWLFEDISAEVPQPLRHLIISERAHEQLGEFSRSVAARALALSAALAAGQADAFASTRRLESAQDINLARVDPRHHLLFRVTRTELHVEQVIEQQDLERLQA